MKRFFDIFLAAALFLLLIPAIIVISISVKLTSPGPAIYWSDRFGRHNCIFSMPKFRTMASEAPALPTHLMNEPERYLTPIGSFLRRTSLDEIPQLYSILIGDMSFVGPRPALFNQDDLIALRTEHGIDELLPGLTGWAQVRGRDDLAIPAKVALEMEYFAKRSFLLDMKIMLITLAKVFRGEGVTH